MKIILRKYKFDLLENVSIQSVTDLIIFFTRHANDYRLKIVLHFFAI